MGKEIAAPIRGPKSQIPLSAGLAGTMVVGLVLYLACSGSKEAPPPDPGPPAAVETKKPAVDEAAVAFEQVASFAATSTDPEAVLLKCRDARSNLRGTPYESRLEEIEKRARESRDRSLKE